MRKCAESGAPENGNSHIRLVSCGEHHHKFSTDVSVRVQIPRIAICRRSTMSPNHKTNPKILMRTILTFLLLAETCTVLRAQTTTPVEFDYLDPSVTSKKLLLPIDDRVSVRIININKKFVAITNTLTSTDYHTDVPKIFNDTFSAVASPNGAAAGFNPPDDDLFDLAVVSGLSDPAFKVRANRLAARYQDIKKQLDARHGKLALFVDRNNYFRQATEYQGDIIEIQDRCGEKYSAIAAAFIQHTVDAFQAAEMGYTEITGNQVGDFTTNKILNRGFIRNFLTKLYQSSKTLYAELNAWFSDTNETFITKAVADLKTDMAMLITDIKSKRVARDHAFINAAEASTNIDALEAMRRGDRLFFDALGSKEISETMDAFAASGFKSLFDAYDYINETNYTYVVPAHSIDKDLLTISIEISPKDDVPCTMQPASYLVDVRAKSGWKIDFSSGMFGTFGGKNFLDQSYSLDSSSTDATHAKIVQNKSKNTVSPAVGALMHIYKRNGKDFHTSFCFGLSTKELSRINYHFGGSLIMGTSQRFIVNGGVTVSKATLISDSYQVGQIIARKGAPSTIPTSDFTRVGFFVALTYNLSK